MLTAEQLDEIRRIVRLEALRAAVFSTASESLDEYVPRLVVDIELAGENLAASITYFDASGNMTAGGTL
jgi:hypothetical protein